MKYADFKLTREDLITCNGFFDFARDNPNVVFVKPDTLLYETPWTEFLGEKPHPKSGIPPKERIWISGHSDFSITEYLVEKYSAHFDHWFAVNATSKDPRIIPTPLGMNSPEDVYSALFSSLQIPRSYKNKAFMSFTVHTNPTERATAQAVLETQPWVTWAYPLSQEEYYRNIRSHPFTICPQGNGYDTHRFWEALYCGSIPIIRENPVVLAFKDKLPIVIIKNWLDLTEDYLDMEYERIMSYDTYDESFLKQSAWFEKIQALVEK